MNHLDVYYRALREYRSLTSDDRECRAQRRAVSKANTEQDRIVITRNICTVDEDWILAIEKGLIFVEKAIKEERQFIYSNGEVVPIEKVKHVSKDSVQHLAKHSNLITKEQTGKDIIPDQIYSVERLNDYAVYENRFLYMLLCYLRDFITIRYDKILELSNKYDGVLQLNKEVTLPNHKITYSVDLHDERKDDKYLRENNPSKDIIDRIDLILKTVMAFLATPLMEIAGKAAKLKPPITKTNVLKMDNNFKGAVALYDFIIAYDKPGYSSEKQVKELSPFNEGVAEEVADVISLLPFLAYEHGLGLEELLKERFDREEQRRKAEEIQKKQEQLAMLKKRLAHMEITPEEYILALEKQVKLLHNDNRQIVPLRDRVLQLEQSEADLKAQLEALHAEYDELNLLLESTIEEHARELERQAQKYDERIHEIYVAHEQELDRLTAQYKEHLETMRQQHSQEVASLTDTYEKRLQELDERMQETERSLKQQLADVSSQLDESDHRYDVLENKYFSLTQEKRVCEARIKALLVESGHEYSDNAYTDQAAFDELERELEAFVNFYEDRWGKVKKKIRKQLLNYQSLKGQKGSKKQP